MTFASVAWAVFLVWWSAGAVGSLGTPALIVRAGAGVEDVAWGAAAELLAGALRAEGATVSVEPPPHCAAPPDAPLCLRGALAALRRGPGAVALALPVAAGAAGPLAERLRDLGLVDLGDAAPPARRACVLLSPPAAPALSALHQLAEPALAAAYAVPPDDDITLRNITDSDDTQFSPAWCAGAGCARLEVVSARELHVVRAEVARLRLYARVHVVAAWGARAGPAVACGWEWALPTGPALAAPACAPGAAAVSEQAAECPWEARRLVKLAREVWLASAARPARVLARFRLEPGELRALAAGAALPGAGLAGRWAAGPARAARVAVLVPAGEEGGLALAAAAALAEEHLERDAPLKVQVCEAGTSAARALRVATDALASGEYGTLSALAAPGGWAGGSLGALGAAFRLPALALGPGGGAAAPGGWALLAGGEARQAARALAQVLAAWGWRRAVLLSDVPRAAQGLRDVSVLLHLDRADSADDAADHRHIHQWALSAAALDARVVVVWVRSARRLAAALCAGGAAGLLPARGAVWLAVAPPAPAPGVALPACARAAADHMLQLRWEWEARPAPPVAWYGGLARHCALLAGGAGGAEAARCAADGRGAALYDALAVWARALRRLRDHDPAAADDLHDPAVARKLIEYATTMNYTGLTGPFEWEDASEEVESAFPGARLGPTRARRGALLLEQWRGGVPRAVGRWERGRLWRGEPPRWLTAGGAPPGDGGPGCAPLGGLARALGSCAAALAAAGALACSALLAALAGAALYGKRRLERRFRARLAALARAPAHCAPDRWELPRPHVVINRRLGGGAFGAVYGGLARLHAAAPGWTPVAVKMLRPGASTDEKLDFLAEAEAMKPLEHPNVVRLLGVVTQSEPVCCVMEFVLHGDLKGYLLARRHLAERGGPGAEDVSPARLTVFARDAARALSYLAERRVLHRDVAARNCLVSARGAVKLADFGMARCVFERDYYRLGRRGMLPVRWMSPEALARGEFSAASDVWALAVLLLEIVTLGALPYAALTNRQVVARVAAGGAPPLPAGLAPPLAGLLGACWAAAPGARPLAAEVAAWLAEGGRLLSPSLLPVAEAVVPPAEGAEGSADTDCTYLSDSPPHAPLLP